MVYIDLLAIEDFILNYIVLYGTAILLNRITKFKKIFLASAIGNLSLIFLFLNLNKKLILLITVLFSVIMSIISFGYHDIKYTIKNTIYMYFVSIFLSGTMHLINIYFFIKTNKYVLNVVVYTIVSPIITYLYIKLTKQIKNNYSNYYKVDIYFKDKSIITVSSFLDTGNKLKDPYSHKPIILLSKKITNYSPNKILLIPYNTITDSGLLKCFPPEKIYIDGIGYRKHVLISLIDEINIEGADCILNPALLGGKND